MHYTSSRMNRPLPIIQALQDSYKIWHETLPNIPKTKRYTIGAKIDSLFIETIEPIVIATTEYREQKQPHIRTASAKLDLLKFFLQMAWNIQAIDTKKYTLFSEALFEIGKMLGGWKKQLEKQTLTDAR